MILVDPRVGSKQFVDLIANRVNCKVVYAKPNLDGGDFAFEGKGPDDQSMMIGVELKRLEDMLGSMRSGRFAGDQLINKMAPAYDICYLIVQGLWKPDANGNLVVPKRVHGKTSWEVLDLAAKHKHASICFRYSELDKFITTLELKKNVIVVRSCSEMETAWQVINRYNWWQKDWDEHNSADPIKLQAEVMYTKVSLLRDMSSRIPSIGWGRSKDVEKAFMSVHHMVNASVEMWESIPGIGHKIAYKVWSLLRERGI